MSTRHLSMGETACRQSSNWQRCCSADSMRQTPPRDIHVDAATQPVALMLSASNRGSELMQRIRHSRSCVSCRGREGTLGPEDQDGFTA